MKYNNDMVFNERTGKWYKNGRGAGHSLEESCKNCGERYFMRLDKPTEFCSYGCSRTGENNHMFGQTHTEESKDKLRESIKKTQKTIKETYGVDNISQLSHIKKKKGQFIVSYDSVRPLVEEQGKTLVSLSGDTKHAIMVIQCENGHEYEMKYHSWRSDRGCRRCFYDSLIAKGITDIEGFNEYKRHMRNATMRVYRKHKTTINPLNKKRGKDKDGDYQIDHKYSILEGFKNNVHIEVISSPYNLEMLTVSENTSKQDRCSITLDELMEKYNNGHI